MAQDRTRHKSRRRRASWIGFCMVILATLSVCSAENAEDKSLSLTSKDGGPSNVPSFSANIPTEPEPEVNFDPMVEATKAYKQALQTLSTIPAYPSPQTRSVLDAQPNSILSTLFPNQQGPIATTIRIIYKLRQQSWMPLFISASLGAGGWVPGKKTEELDIKATKTVDLLEHAAELGHMDALYKLAHVSLFHFSPLLHNSSRAFEAYRTHADLTGNATSQSILAFFYSTGYDGIVEIDQAKALLYYTFASHNGNQGAQMALGYRYFAGIGVNDDCLSSLEWYQMSAEQSMAKFLSGPPGGRTLLHTTTKLSDLNGGIYGPGASVASTGLNAHRAVIKAASARQAGETWEDVLEYYMFSAARGETDFAYRLGKIFYQGSIYSIPGGISSGGEGVGAIPRDFHRARYYFLRIARNIWTHDAPGVQPVLKQEQKDDGTLSYAVLSAAFLGRMYLRGEGVKQDAAMAKMWFMRGAEYNEKECHNGLGIIYRDGLVDGKTDIKSAIYHFGQAANQELAEAQTNLGKHHYYRRDIKLATTYFEAAIRHGSPFEPYYYLAEIHAAAAQSPDTPDHHRQASCAMAASFYKHISERGVWAEDLMREGEALWKLGTDNAKEAAILRWWIASERGFEAAQNNLAYILDQDKSILRLTRFAPSVPSNGTARLALTQWTRSAAQRNVDALVKVGDYYYHGLGVPDEPEAKRWEKAAGFYQSAVDTQVSALAMWNLGWMYENGVGVPQDFYLAKRHYDLALETNSEAYLPVTLSLIKLYVRSIWHTMRGGQNGLNFWPEEDKSQRESPALEGGKGDDDMSGEDTNGQYVEDADSSQWYKGKAKDEHKKRLRAAEEKILRNEEDPIQWARDRKNAESERDRDFGPEDYFEGATRGGRRGEDDDENDFVETMLLVFLCLTVSLLMYIRRRWVERWQAEEEQRRAGGPGAPGAPAPPNNGMFPPAGDPARNEWAILR